MFQLNEVGWGDTYSTSESANLMGIQPLRGFYFTNCSQNATCTLDREKQLGLLQMADEDKFDFKQHFPDAINETGSLRKIFPTVDFAIYNRGLWGRLNVKRSKHIFHLMHEWTGNGLGRCFFKATTATHPGHNEMQTFEQLEIGKTSLEEGCGFLDYGHVTMEFSQLQFTHPRPPSMDAGRLNGMFERSFVYWDKVHFTPWVYEELNNILLNVLCNK
jgi:hypothetical protein